MKKRVLIVDDDDLWIIYTSSLLKSLFDNIEVESASSAREAFDKVFENLKTPYNLIITDLQMENNYYPQHAGEWLISEIQTFCKTVNTNILLFSASSEIDSIANQLNCNFFKKLDAHQDNDAYANLLKMFLN